MNISNFVEFLNKNRGWTISKEYYNNIAEWKLWWMGYNEAFHKRSEQGLSGARIKRDMFSLRMAKQVCEDWATLLLNDKTLINVDDTRTAKWLTGGSDAQQTAGVLHDLDFWTRANGLVELAFRSGTGAFVVSVENALRDGGAWVKSKDARISMDFLPAECILPITVRHGRVVESAFASECVESGKKCVYMQTHLLRNGQYVIYNEYFRTNENSGDGEGYEAMQLPAGMAREVKTGSSLPWFALFTPAAEKNIRDGSGMGMAVFSEAIDAIKFADMAFDNYTMDIFLGGKKVFYNRELTETIVNSDGSVARVAPDDVRQQLFLQTAGGDPDESPDWHEYNPDLRTESNSQAIQNALDYISFKCGLGTHHYQFDSGAVATATQYTGDRQDMIQHAERHHTRIEAALLQIMRAVLWIGKNICGENINTEAAMTIGWDDSYISDASSRRLQDQQDALNGFIPKWRYNMEWRGMSETEAKQAVSEATQETSEANNAALDLFAGA